MVQVAVKVDKDLVIAREFILGTLGLLSDRKHLGRLGVGLVFFDLLLGRGQLLLQSTTLLQLCRGCVSLLRSLFLSKH